MTELPSSTNYLPDEVTYGFVADRIILSVGDTLNDGDRFPDGVPADGVVRFIPARTQFYTREEPATILPQEIRCTIYNKNHPVAIETGYDSNLAGKLVDPAGHVGNVALVVGRYHVTYQLDTGQPHRVTINVKATHTNENPLWIPAEAELTPLPQERFVVNERVYRETAEARNEAVEARDEAVEARDEAVPAAGTASDWALRAEAAAAASEALGITVDTSVGTLVYVGDTMIHGDTGWRVLVGWDTTGIPYVGQFPEGLSARPQPNSETFIRGDIRIRRINDSVMLQYRSVQINAVCVSIPAPIAFTASNPATSLSVPTIFRSSNWNDILPGYADIRAGEIRLRYPDEAVGKTSTSETSNFISWTTAMDWSTTLPEFQHKEHI